MREIINDPHTHPQTPSEQLAASLRDAPLALDEFARARMERNLVDAWRVRGARAVALPASGRGPTRGAWVLSVALSAAAGVLLGLAMLRSHDRYQDGYHEGYDGRASNSGNVIAHFELVIDDGAVQSGYLTEGQMLESGKHGRIEVGLAQSRVDIAPDSRVRFERLAQDELRLSLVIGHVEVAFHPEHKGKDRMSVETRAARVLVVGTRFEVVANASGDTTVIVSEGVVQVVPRSGGETRFVRAGERLDVPVEAPIDRERAVREGIKARLAQEDADEGTGEARGAAGTGGDHVDAASAEREQHVHEASLQRRLEAARNLLMQGKHAAARERLQKLAKSALPTGGRVEALTLIAESYTAQGQIPRATDAYREAVRIAPHHPAGYNALFALARLLERHSEDKSSAGTAYREYLARAPSGALAPQAREALCRLGDASSCK